MWRMSSQRDHYLVPAGWGGMINRPDRHVPLRHPMRCLCGVNHRQGLMLMWNERCGMGACKIVGVSIRRSEW